MGVTICGHTSNVNRCKGGKHHWGGNVAIHKGAGVDRSTTKGDGDRSECVKGYREEKMCNHG
jgi:hypothetical protein